jgi:hypothetical protein
MAAIVESIDISRRPGDVFADAADFWHFPEWQGGVVSVRREGDGPLAVAHRLHLLRADLDWVDAELAALAREEEAPMPRPSG